MSYLDVTVTINEVDYTGQTLGTVRVRRGSQDIDETAVAGYSLCELIDETGAGFPITVTDRVTVTIENSVGPVTVFTGTVSDWNTRLYVTRNGQAAIWSILASGPLALANRRQVMFAGAASEADGDRALRILRQGLTQTWREYQGTTWTAETTATWETVDPGFDDTIVATPGDYTLAALAAQDTGYNALQALGDVQTSVGGHVFETGTGSVGYLSAYGRSALAAAGYQPLPTSLLVSAGVTSQEQASDLVNVLELTYSGGAVEREELESIRRHGIRTGVLNTLLVDLSAAEDRAEDLLFDRAFPRVKLPEVTFALHTISPAWADDLLAIQENTPVNLAGLPPTLGSVNSRGFVEGLQYDFGAERRQVTFYISDAQLSLASERWRDVTSTIAWEDVSATLEWADARRVTV